MLRMKRNHLHCSAPVLFLLLWPWVLLAAPCPEGQTCVCLHCPAGQEPSTACSEAKGSDTVVDCRRCPPGTFSDTYGPIQCTAHTQCKSLNRHVMMPGTSGSDTVCGACLSGFTLATSIQISFTPRFCIRESLSRLRRNAGKSARAAGSDGARAGRANSTAVHAAEDKTTEYAVFALVPVFCVMGLLGILICNVLKKKGYKCAAEKEGSEVEAATLQKDGNPGPFVIEDQNEDTISALVRLITEKKENATALEELLMEYEKKQTSGSKRSSIKFPSFLQFRSLPRLCHHHHLHTITGFAPHSGLSCSRCSQRKWPQVLLPLTTNKTSCATSIPSSPSEGRVLNVGRFQVAQIPEGDPVSVAMTPVQSSDTDSVDTDIDPAEELFFLSMCSAAKSSSSKSKEDLNE